MFKFHLPKGFEGRKIKLRFKEDIEPQEILLDKLAQKREEGLGISEKKLEVPLLRKILQGFLFFVFLLLIVLFAKTFQLQIIQGENFSALAEENKFIIHQIQAERGVIYDQSLNQLVFNRPSFDLILNVGSLPSDQGKKIKILKEVSEIINKDFETLKKEISENNFPQFPVAENLDHQTLILLETKINGLSGFQIRRNTVRYYQNGEIFSHLIGYTGKITVKELREREGRSIFDWVGRKGVEGHYEDVLRKNPGELRVKKDALGNIISKEVVSLPEPGKSLVLWLDSDLQEKITQELEKSIKAVGSKAGTAVALDPRTGGVLALVSLPGFDNNLFQKGGDRESLKHLLEDPLGLEPLFNRVISGQYMPGSTIKPLIALAALEENLIDPEKQILADGKIEIPHRYDPDIIYTFRDWKVHGWTDMRKAIADSVNIYFYTIGGGHKKQKGLGPTRIKKYLEMFGWGEPTQIDLAGEAKGLVPDPAWKKRAIGEDWWDGDTYFLSIGQQYILTTPIQVATAFAAVANGGILYQPRIVQKILDGEEVKAKIIRENFIDSEKLEIVKQGMRQAVTHGSATALNRLPVEAAAKTGTAETPIEGHYHHWVTVFAPYDDPQIVLTIMIENIEGVRAATLPVAKAVLDWHFTRDGK